jgi:hypothetical protein
VSSLNSINVSLSLTISWRRSYPKSILVSEYLSRRRLAEGGWMGDPFHDKESEQFVARYIERGPLALDKLSIPDFAEATSGHFRRREGPAKASMATAGRTISLPIPPKTK